MLNILLRGADSTILYIFFLLQIIALNLNNQTQIAVELRLVVQNLLCLLRITYSLVAIQSSEKKENKSRDSRHRRNNSFPFLAGATKIDQTFKEAFLVTWKGF